MIPVRITINENGIKSVPDPVPVLRGKTNERISWRIATPGWRFTSDGIVIHANLNQFTARGSDNSREFHWKSRNTKKKRYEYTINVTNGATFASLDPGIRNGGR
jgi:hypothetical protein